MSEPQSPWSPPPPPKPRGPVYRPPLNRNQLGWLALILVVAVASIWAMNELMPGKASFQTDVPEMAQWLMLLTIMGAAVVRLRLHPREAIRNILIWIVIAAAIGLGYTAWTEFQASQHKSPPVKAQPQAPTGGNTEQA